MRNRVIYSLLDARENVKFCKGIAKNIDVGFMLPYLISDRVGKA